MIPCILTVCLLKCRQSVDAGCIGVDEIGELTFVMCIYIGGGHHWYGGSVVRRMAQLVDIPVGGEIRQIDYTHISAVSLYLLCVP